MLIFCIMLTRCYVCLAISYRRSAPFLFFRCDKSCLMTLQHIHTRRISGPRKGVNSSADDRGDMRIYGIECNIVGDQCWMPEGPELRRTVLRNDCESKGSSSRKWVHGSFFL